jgi:hypothetical protein
VAAETKGLHQFFGPIDLRVLLPINAILYVLAVVHDDLPNAMSTILVAY